MKKQAPFWWVWWTTLCGLVLSAHAASLDVVQDTHMQAEDGGTTPMSHTMDPSHEEGMGMAMYFHGGSEEIVLFKKWDTMTWQDMLVTCVGLFLVAVLYEGFKLSRQILYNRKQPTSKTQLLRESYQMTYNAYGSFDTGQCAIESSILDMSESDDERSECCQTQHRMCSGWHWLQSLLYMIQMFIGYCLMLSVMTYNVYIFIAVLLGAGVGHILFGWMSPKDTGSSEICH